MKKLDDSKNRLFFKFIQRLHEFTRICCVVCWFGTNLHNALNTDWMCVRHVRASNHMGCETNAILTTYSWHAIANNKHEESTKRTYKFTIMPLVRLFVFGCSNCFFSSFFALSMICSEMRSKYMNWRTSWFVDNKLISFIKFKWDL